MGRMDAFGDIISTVYCLCVAQSMGARKKKNPSILHHKTEGKSRKSWIEVRWKERVLSYEDETLKRPWLFIQKNICQMLDSGPCTSTPPNQASWRNCTQLFLNDAVGTWYPPKSMVPAYPCPTLPSLLGAWYPLTPTCPTLPPLPVWLLLSADECLGTNIG